MYVFYFHIKKKVIACLILDSEQCDKCIHFTMMSVVFVCPRTR